MHLPWVSENSESESRLVDADEVSRYFSTAMTEQYHTDPKYKAFNDYVMMRTPAKRWGQPVDLSGAIIFLASGASDFVSGTSIVVDGGWLGN